ncbi:MAG: hypothetical protein PHP52_06550 [Bacteroidales bacterium]|nr:hypothetical protein [Bacteroidales bacterium]MDD4215888.1 hypothetical protein [Bacteroidales bacterium]MDY0141147.1 hypothetical protein [Bacteroidales bacterium]
MDSNILEEYKLYYAARSEKYKNNPEYANSYKAEKQLSDSMQACSSLDDFKDDAVKLGKACAIALVKDENLIEKKYYEKHQEVFRVKASERILEKIDSCETLLDVSAMISEETSKTSVEESMDDSHRKVIDDWSQIDEITIYENAVVPDKYKRYMMEMAADIKESLIEGVTMLEENNAPWQSGWKLIPEKALEYRHLRLLPFSKTHVEEQIAKYKSIINR